MADQRLIGAVCDETVIPILDDAHKVIFSGFCHV